jgi:type VI secretion system protein ImpA
MAIDWLTTPVSEDAPCGPDLLEADDDAFVSYYFEAEGTLPERYFTAGARGADEAVQPGTLFDPKTISHQKERDAVLALLKRSRDLRLLSLMARQQALAQRIDGVADALVGMADLLEVFPNDVNPKAGSDRRSAMEELAVTATMVAPLQYMPLAGAAAVSLRRVMVARGEAEPRTGEEGLQESDLMGMMAAPSARAAVDRTAAALDDIAGALARIKAACLRGERPFTLNIAATEAAVVGMRQAIADARPDLGPASAAPATGTDAPADAPADDAPAAVPVRAAATPARQVASQGEARAALRAVEMFFFRNEPSSAALLLVTQARLLVGKPLVDAIETLMPEDAPKTRIDFGAATGFAMSMERLRILSDEIASLAPANPGPDPDPPVITERTDIAGWLSGVDHYFRTREPASPVPLLLARAKAYLDKDFGALIAEIIPSAGKG